MRVVKFKKYILTAVSAGLLMLCGCTGDNNVYDEYLTTFIEGAVNTIDSTMNGDSGSDSVISNVQSSLFRRKADGSLLPDLAESYEVSEDGLTYTFHLRDSYWSNGEPVTAHDFVFGMKHYLEDGGMMPGFYIEMANIKNAGNIYYGDEDGNHPDIDELGVRALDDRTLEITIEYPIEYLPTILSLGAFSPINEEFYKSQEPGMYATGPDTILCSGPFVIEDYIPGTSSVLVRKNQYYWDAENVKLPGIRFVTIANSDTAISAFKIGEVEATKVSQESHNDCENNPELAPYLHDYNMGAFSYLVFNVSEEYGTRFSTNRNLRLAISNAINRDSICENFLSGAAEPVYMPMPQNTFFNPETNEDFIQNPKLYSEYCDYDVKKAVEYFEKAKTELDEDNIEITILVASTNSKLAQILKEQLEKNLPGLTVNIEVIQFAERSTRMKKFDYEVVIMGYIPDYTDPMSMFTLYADKTELNGAGYHSDEFMEVYRKCTVGEYSMNHDERWKAMQDALEIVVKDQPIVPLYTSYRSVLSVDNLKGVDYLPAGTVLYRDAWLE